MYLNIINLEKIIIIYSRKIIKYLISEELIKLSNNLLRKRINVYNKIIILYLLENNKLNIL